MPHTRPSRCSKSFSPGVSSRSPMPRWRPSASSRSTTGSDHLGHARPRPRRTARRAANVVSASTAIGSAEAMRGHGSRALEEALELAQAHGADDQVARAIRPSSYVGAEQNWPAVDRWLRGGLTYSRNDLDDHRNYLLAWRADAALDRGHWDDAAVAAQRPSITRTRSSTERGRCSCSVRCGPGAAIPESGLSSTKRSSS